MAITGVAGLLYGVGLLDLSARFYDDFGLQLELEDDRRAVFRLSEGSTVELHHADDPELPPAFLAGPGPREVIWGVDSAEGLAEIGEELSRDREVVTDASGALHTRDDAGLNIGFRLWKRRLVDADQPQGENSPWRPVRVNSNRRWYPRARPSLINHVVFGAPDPETAAAFYIDRLDFRLTDVMRDVGVFLRCDGRAEHHNIFFRKRRDLRFEHVSFGVEDIDELMVGANEMRRRGWTSREGLGRHRMGSLLFYYIDCPAGGQAEYTADGDYVTDDWKPRIWDVAFGNHYWLADLGERANIDHSGSPAPMEVQPSTGSLCAGLDQPKTAHGLPIDHGGPEDRPFEPFSYDALEGSIVDRFLAITGRYGDRPAVQDAQTSLTYAELAERAACIAAALHPILAGRSGPVAILLENDSRLPAAIFGVLATSRAFIPLDPSHPIERNLLIAAHAGAAVVLSGGAMTAALREGLGADTPLVDIDAAMEHPGSGPWLRAEPDELAYLLYTSGSTGVPKGVCHSHRNCLHDVLVLTNNGRLSCEDRIGVFYGGVIGAIRRIFSTLLNGASLHILPPLELEAEGLARQIRTRGLTCYHGVPTLFRRIAAAVPEGERLDTLRLVRLSGDRSDWGDYDLFRRVCPPDAHFGISLGSTEVSSTYAHWFVDPSVREPGGRLPVGREMDDVLVEIVGEGGRVLADGETGEFRVTSRYLALGYWRAPELTAARFSTDPADPDARVFLTGDMGYRRPDGLLEFVGRKDDMIKLRGHRIEPAEVETALRACQGVPDAAVIIRRSGEGLPRAMVAYVELEDGFEGLLPRHLMAMLAQVLPAYLLPSVIFVVDELPRLVNFKVDRPRLARLDAERADGDSGRAADPVLDGVALAMESVVPGARATAEDNLLSLGGDSLQAVELALELERKFGFAVPARVIRQSQCIRELSDWICSHQQGAAGRSEAKGIKA